MATKRATTVATAKTPRKTARARPTAYSPETFAAICAGLADGKSLVQVCARAGMPSRQTVHTWLAEDPELQKSYVAAREAQADFLAEDILDISNALTKGPNGRKRTPSKQEIAAVRVQMDARKWYAGKVRPKKWGDKIDLNVQQTTRTLAQKTDTELQDELVQAAAQLTAMGIELPNCVALLVANGAQGQSDADAG